MLVGILRTEWARLTASFSLFCPRSGEYAGVQRYNKIARRLAINNVLQHVIEYVLYPLRSDFDYFTSCLIQVDTVFYVLYGHEHAKYPDWELLYDALMFYPRANTEIE